MGLLKNSNGEFQIHAIHHLDYEEAYYRLSALISMLQEADPDNSSKADIFYTCAMIRDLLPSLDDFMILNRHHNKN